MVRAMPLLLAAGIFIGMGLVALADWTPWYYIFNGTPFNFPTMLTWIGLASGMVALVAGLIAATGRQPTVA